MLGWKYEKFKAELPQDKFEELLQLFQELLPILQAMLKTLSNG